MEEHLIMPRYVDLAAVYLPIKKFVYWPAKFGLLRATGSLGTSISTYKLDDLYFLASHTRKEETNLSFIHATSWAGKRRPMEDNLLPPPQGPRCCGPSRMQASSPRPACHGWPCLLHSSLCGLTFAGAIPLREQPWKALGQLLRLSSSLPSFSRLPGSSSPLGIWTIPKRKIIPPSQEGRGKTGGYRAASQVCL